MSPREQYQPAPAFGARVDKATEQWTLVLVRDLRHSPERVWEALTDPAQLREWAPFDADHTLDRVGPVTLSTVNAPHPQVDDTRVVRADRPRVLEYMWGGSPLRWELEPTAKGTRLTLWHQIDRRFVAMGAAGWHVCLDVMAHALDGDPIGRIVGMDAMHFDGWHRLHGEYAKQFGGEGGDA